MIDVWVSSRKVTLLGQSLWMLLLVLMSGAVIPTLYFPLAVQAVLPYVFSYESMNWLIDIILEERNYANFTVLAAFAVVGSLLLWVSTVWKGRLVQ